MTANQLRYWELQETKRSNAAKEAETNRSNVAKENETHRHNKWGEVLDTGRLTLESFDTAFNGVKTIGGVIFGKGGIMGALS